MKNNIYYCRNWQQRSNNKCCIISYNFYESQNRKKIISLLFFKYLRLKSKALPNINVLTIIKSKIFLVEKYFSSENVFFPLPLRTFKIKCYRTTNNVSETDYFIGFTKHPFFSYFQTKLASVPTTGQGCTSV